MKDDKTIWFVLDANVYLHYRFREIPWADVLRKEFGCTSQNFGIGVPQKVIQREFDISNQKSISWLSE